MRTRLFEWATEQKLSMAQLSALTGYTPRHLYRIRKLERANADVPAPFKAALVDRMGDWARSLFLPSVSPARANVPLRRDSVDSVATGPSEAPDARGDGHEGKDTTACKKPLRRRPAASTKERAA